MNIKLVDGLPYHPTLRHPRSGARLRAVYQRKNGAYVWPVLGASGDDGAGDDSDGDKGEDSDKKDGDESADDKSGEKKEEKDTRTDREKDLEAELDRVKKHRSAADKKRETAEQELKDLKKKDLPEAEKIVAERDEAVKDRDNWQGKYQALAVQTAFLKASQNAGITWHDADDAIVAARMKDVSVEEDGSVSGMKSIVTKLAKDKPHLVNAPKKGEDEENQNGKAERGPSGSGVGSGAGKGKGTAGAASREELLRKYPALRN